MQIGNVAVLFEKGDRDRNPCTPQVAATRTRRWTMLYLLFMLGVVVIGIALIPVALAVI
jgi:hypothetical protein